MPSNYARHGNCEQDGHGSALGVEGRGTVVNRHTGKDCGENKAGGGRVCGDIRHGRDI